MIPMTAFLAFAAIFFGAIGVRRGWRCEMISTAVLFWSQFFLVQMDGWLRNSLLRFATLAQLFIIQAAILLLVFFLTHSNIGWFAQQPLSYAGGRRQVWRMRALAATLGAANSYILVASLWYLLDINLYPFSPLIQAPAPDSPALAAFLALPLLGMAGGPHIWLATGVVITLTALFFKM